MTCCLFDITDSQYVLGLEMENNENLQLCWDSTTKLLLSGSLDHPSLNIWNPPYTEK